MDTNKINIAEILKDCPKGTKLYCTIFGEVEFLGITEDRYYPIAIEDKHRKCTLTKDGLFVIDAGECVLFPSKENRDWSKFQPKKSKFDPKTLKPFNKVLARDADDRTWNALLFSHISNKEKLIVAGWAWEQVIPYNKETKHLVGTSDEAPEYYRYWED